MGTQDDFLRTKGFIVTISDTTQTGKGENESWLTCSGGGDVVEVASATHGTDEHHKFRWGHNTVSPIQLGGYLTSDRKATLEWLKSTTAGGKSPRRTLTISPLGTNGAVTKVHNYAECLIEEYVFPELSSHDHDTLRERVTIRPERHEIA
jgi:hypothetical protein